tara:strand:- start:60966 stop:66419 length:5454 start_codon:yes stop_codon:yes gene_type:complete
MKKIAISLKMCILIFCTSLSYNVFSQTSPLPFTTSGTFTVPPGVSQVNIQAWGAGGGGSDRSGNGSDGGNGGGGGGFRGGTFAVTPGDVLTITIGNGGARAINGNGNDGSPGQETRITSGSGTDGIVAYGGAGGVVGTNAGGSAATGGGGTFLGTVTNQTNFKGGNGGIGDGNRGGGGGGGAGSTAAGNNGGNPGGGNGGNLNGGNGGNGGNRNSGTSGSTYGGGGGGAGDGAGGSGTGAAGLGGNGANGYAILSWTAALPEIDITGLGYSIIGDGTNTPTLSNNTDYGKVQITSQIVTKTFIIHNTGTGDLTLGAISLSGTTEFTIGSAPSSGTVILPGNTENIVISFTTSTIGIQTDILTIVSDDSDEATYQINLKAEGSKVFYDSDGDGVYDDVDIDDDNDGIIDSNEENNCRLSNGASKADYKFLNETFGFGTTRSTAISTLYTATTTYCIEDGDGVGSPCGPAFDYYGLQDGEYAVHNMITTGISGETVGPTDAIAPWAWYAWAPIEDHTPGDTNGRMAIFNANEDPGTFYETEITGTLANVPITYSFWAINIDEPDQNFIDNEHGGNPATFVHRLLPNVTVNFLTSDRSTIIATFDTGDITRCGDLFVPGDHTGTYPHAADATYNTCETSVWQQFSQQFTTSETSFIVQFVNNAAGGLGNDLAIDDIEIRQTLCDMDSDGIADVFDLDSDDDGIPDVVEANPTAASLSEGKASLTYVSSWVDTNGNGVHDGLETLPSADSNSNGIPNEFDTDLNADGIPDYIFDTDGDGIPDYLDLDSDNDGLFDVDEYGVKSSSASVTYQNGDGDITGDGTGDGPETEAFREKDSDGNGTIEYYGDGILDIYDFHTAGGVQTYPNSYGNVGQGTAPFYALVSPGNSIPDYRNPKSNRNGHPLDIDNQEVYSYLFPHDVNGILLDTTDADGDGIVASRDGDDAIFGSPRNLDSSYSLYFDGRNDYVEDANVISSGAATLMAFVKTDGANTNNNNQTVAGQDNFKIIVENGTNTVTAKIGVTTFSSGTTIPSSIWSHVAVTTTAGKSIIYINGVKKDSITSGGISDASNFMIGRATSDNNYFKGEIDEVRVFDAALTANELKRMVYQELDDANSFNRGKIIPLDISASIGSNLIKYYKMDGYQDDILDDKKTGTIDQITGAKMYNFKDIYFQRAPLPYVTNADGDWTNSASWGTVLPNGSVLDGNQWDIMTKQNNPDGASIVHIKNNINLDGSYNTQGMVGLIVDNGQEFTIEADKGLYNSWYLDLNGLIDLEGESQLVQTEGSVLRQESSGALERDQQGTSNTYIYNYWASPVSVIGGTSSPTTPHASYTLPDVISNVGFLTSGYNGTASPVRNADYWIWKYANLANNDYSLWQHVRSTGSMQAGQGFTMKGPGTATPDQNYVFLGKPYNGDITLPIATGNEYLVGNPYASAIDADEFIKDNISTSETQGRNATGNVINGALYFWDHFSVASHALAEYQGGYATYTLMGGAVAINNDVRINATGTSGIKFPLRYIPVGQGFFVSAILDADLNNDGTDPDPNDPALSQPIVGGDIVFKNSQRVFKTEALDPSLFLKSSDVKSKPNAASETEVDNRKKIRLMFDSPSGYHRQLLLGADENATSQFDLGYEAVLIESNKEDMFWTYKSAKLVIQAINNFNEEQVLPLGIRVKKAGLVTIKIVALENIDSNTNVYLHDIELDIYHDLKLSHYEVYIATAGEYLNRFEITFNNSLSKSLGVDDIDDQALQVYYANDKTSLILHNPNLKEIKSAELFNILGQSVYKINDIESKNYSEFKTHGIIPGTYIIKLKTKDNTNLSKKVLIK